MKQFEIKKGMMFRNKNNPYISFEVVTSIRKGWPYTKCMPTRTGKFTKPKPFGLWPESLNDYLNWPSVEIL